MTQAPTEDVERRGSRTGRDMVISMVVLLIPIAIVVAVFRLKGGEDVVVVDPAPAVAAARASGAFPVAAPGDLPEGWHCVSARFSSGVLRLGYLTPDGGALQVIESNEPVAGLLIRELGGDMRPTGPVDEWRSYEVRNGEHALVRTDSGRTLIVVGQAAVGDLRTLAGALRD